MNAIIKTIAAMPGVERVNEWKDRHYITLAAVRGSRAKADHSTKIWIKGETLTIEQGKGYHSDEFSATKYAIIDAVHAAGGNVREI